MFTKNPYKLLSIISILGTAALLSYFVVANMTLSLSPSEPVQSELIKHYAVLAIILLFTFVVIPFQITKSEIEHYKHQNQPKVTIDSSPVPPQTMSTNKILMTTLISVVISPVLVIIFAFFTAIIYLVFTSAILSLL